MISLCPVVSGAFFPFAWLPLWSGVCFRYSVVWPLSAFLATALLRTHVPTEHIPTISPNDRWAIRYELGWYAPIQYTIFMSAT